MVLRIHLHDSDYMITIITDIISDKLHSVIDLNPM